MLILKIFIVGGLQRLFSNLKAFFTGSKPPLGAAGLTVLCPIVNDADEQQSYAMRVIEYLQDMPEHEKSPMAKVPNTYLCRFYVLNDVFYQGYPADEEHLKSRYLVFSSNYYGDLDSYLSGMWEHAQADVKSIWQHCVAFDKVQSATDFVAYMKKCQVKNHLFFNGSTGDPLAEQLKTLYLKQEFSRFVYEQNGNTPVSSGSPEELQKAFQAFIERTQPDDLDGPTWVAGADQELIKLKEG